MKNGYLIKVSMEAKLIDELALCEEGRYEDKARELGLDLSQEDMEEGRCDPLTYLILQRFKTLIAIKSQKEAEEIYWAVSSGTFQLSHLRSARRIADALRPLVSKDTARKWYPSGF